MYHFHGKFPKHWLVERKGHGCDKISLCFTLVVCGYLVLLRLEAPTSNMYKGLFQSKVATTANSSGAVPSHRRSPGHLDQCPEDVFELGVGLTIAFVRLPPNSLGLCVQHAYSE